MRAVVILTVPFLFSTDLLCAATTNDDAYSVRLEYFEAFSHDFASTVGALFESFQDTAQGDESCTGYDTLADQLQNHVCDEDFGASKGCDCAGRAIDWDAPVIYASPEVIPAKDTKNFACYTEDLSSPVKDMYASTEVDLKWSYYGAQDGALWNYPGFLWGRDTGDYGTYDPRKRPWYTMGSSGPKDVILVLDKSGSMGVRGRMENAKLAAQNVVDSLTSMDYLSVVSFSTIAESENTYLVPASASHRSSTKAAIGDIQNEGFTYYTRAMQKAFEITERSDDANAHSGCSRIYVFMSDGEPTDDLDDFIALIDSRRQQHDMFFFVALGSNMETINLETAACATGGIFISVPDDDESALYDALASYYAYLAVGNALNQVQPTRWSEPYTSIPDIWGPMTTAVTPVYDKRGSVWSLIGVAAVDLPMRTLYQEAEDFGWVDDQADDFDEMRTKQGCGCAESYEYQGKIYSQECTTDDWSVPWCGTDSVECGFCDEQVSPSGCWDECALDGTVAGKVEATLLERSAECHMPSLTSGALEMLRGDFTCLEDDGTVVDEYDTMLLTANAFTCFEGNPTCEWAAAGYEGDAQPLRGDFDDTSCPSLAPTMEPSISKEPTVEPEESEGWGNNGWWFLTLLVLPVLCVIGGGRENTGAVVPNPSAPSAGVAANLPPGVVVQVATPVPGGEGGDGSVGGTTQVPASGVVVVSTQQHKSSC